MIAFRAGAASGVLPSAMPSSVLGALLAGAMRSAAAAAHEIGTPLSTLAVIAGELRGDAEHRQHGATPVAGYLADLQTMEQQIELCKSILARLREDHATVAPSHRLLAAGLRRALAIAPPAGAAASQCRARGRRAGNRAGRVGQILTILLDNAARSQQGATPPLQLSIALESGTPHATLCFRVADHGGGIAPLLRQHWAKPGGQSHGGQGIGAYLAQSTALRMGGRLSWHDHAGGGTVAELRLPLAARGRRRLNPPSLFPETSPEIRHE